MTDQIAICYGTTIIYWNSLLLCAALVSAFCLCFALYMTEHRYGIVFWAYWPTASVFSLYLARIIHWYCHMEQYESFWAAVTRLEQGDYSIVGILLGSWLAAVLLAALKMAGSRYEILDAAAPGIAFVLAMVRFSDGFGGACLGKMQITEGDSLFCYTTEIGGVLQTRLAVFYISFLWLLAVTVLSIFLFFRRRKKGKKSGSVYQTFLILFCVSEILIDSLRYDSLHLSFHGNKLVDLSKVAGFVGLSQLVAALILIFYMFSFSIRLIRKVRELGEDKASEKKWLRLYNVSLFAGFVAELILAGVCEYLVQRYTADHILWHGIQLIGSILMGACCIVAMRLSWGNEG